MFFSLMGGDAPLGLDNLAHKWHNVLLYAFSSQSEPGEGLGMESRNDFNRSVLAGQTPVAEIAQMLYDQPWLLPAGRDLFSHVQGEILHPSPQRPALWAWPERGSIGMRLDYLGKIFIQFRMLRCLDTFVIHGGYLNPG